MNNLLLLPLILVVCSCCTIDDKPVLIQLTEPYEQAESPTWDPKKNLLFFLDFQTNHVYSYNYYTGEIKTLIIGNSGKVSPVIQCRDPTKLVVGLNRELLVVKWNGYTNEKVDGDKIRRLTTVSREFPDSRINDGKADKEGRLWIGTLGLTYPNGSFQQNKGIFYKITKDNYSHPKIISKPVTISNGLTWNKANNKMYYIDSGTYKVVVFDYDNKKGEISNKKVVFDLKKEYKLTGLLDGMTIDENDNLWVALYGGGSIIHIDSKTGKLIKQLAVPCKYVTSVMFGGPLLDILFVTTSKHYLNELELKGEPAAGALFAFKNLGVKGCPVFKADFE